MLADDPPAISADAPVAKPADMVVVSHDTRSEMLASTDTPMLLVKAGRTEDAMLRQAIFLTSTLTVVRPAEGTGADVLRWAYEPNLQRQLCFTSITGQFACAAGASDDLADKAVGEAPLPAVDGQATFGLNAEAEAARIAVATTLSARAASLFEVDRRLKLNPMLKAAGVSIRRPAGR